MTRAKHGAYDADKGLPDNRGQAQGSGLYVWLCSEVEQRFGADLVEAAQSHGNQRYKWIIGQLEAMDDDTATQLVEEFHRRRLADAAEHRQQHRRNQIAMLQAQIANEPSQQRRAWIEKEVAKIQRSIDKAATK